MLPLGVCAYNGFRFSSYASCTGLKCAYQRDESGMTIPFSRWQITIQDYATGPATVTLSATVASVNGSTIVTELPHGFSIGDIVNGEAVVDVPDAITLVIPGFFAAPGTVITGQHTSIDAQLQQIRRQLSVQGAAFSFNCKGLGDLSVNLPGTGNTPGAKWDVQWGPIPLSFDYDVSGRDQAGRFSWTVEVAIPEGCISPSYKLKFLTLSYVSNFDTDRLGYTRRQLDFTYSVGMTRNSATDPNLPDTADADSYFLAIVPPVPFGFRRLERRRTLSADRRSVKATFTDLQVPSNYLPAGIAEARFRQRLTTSQKGFFGNWGVSFSGSYVVSQDVPRATALFAFLTTCVSRLRKAIDGSCFVVPVAMSMDDDVFGVETGTYSLTCGITTRALDQYKSNFDFLGAAFAMANNTGMYGDSEGDYQTWANSMAISTWAPRGALGLKDVPQNASIVDPCKPLIAQMVSAVSPGQRNFAAVLQEFFPAPTPDLSWLAFQNRIQFFWTTNTAILKSLPPQPPQGGNYAVMQQADATNLDAIQNDPGTGPTFAEMIENNYLTSDSNAPGAPLTSPVDTTTAQRTSPTLYAVLIGHAIRANFDIRPPMLTSVGGQKAVQLGGQVTRQPIADSLYPLFACSWTVYYAIPTWTDRQLPMPADAVIALPGYGA